jgi:hypothetical protein
MVEQGALIVGNNSGHNVLTLKEKAPQDRVALNQTTKDWHPKSVTLSETKGLAVRFFATLRMTRLSGHVVKCTNVMCSGLVTLYYSAQVAGQARGIEEAKRRDLSRFLTFCYDSFRHYRARHIVNPTS